MKRTSAARKTLIIYLVSFLIVMFFKYSGIVDRIMASFGTSRFFFDFAILGLIIIFAVYSSLTLLSGFQGLFKKEMELVFKKFGIPDRSILPPRTARGSYAVFWGLIYIFLGLILLFITLLTIYLVFFR